MPNTFGATDLSAGPVKLYDNVEQWIGTAGPFRIKYNTTTSKLEIQDSAGNVMLSLADGGTVGNLVVTGTLTPGGTGFTTANLTDWDNTARANGYYVVWDTATGKNKYVSATSSVTALTHLSDFVASYTGTDGKIPVYDTATSKFTPVAMSGDATMTKAGVVSIVNDSHAHTSATVALALSNLTDALLSGLANTHVLVYESASGKWKNRALSGGATVSSTGVVTIVPDGHMHTAASVTLASADLTDMDIAARAGGKFLAWNGTTNKLEFVSSSATVATLDGVGDVNAYSGLAAGNVLLWQGSYWANKALSGGATVSSAGVVTLGGSPTFTAVTLGTLNGTSGASLVLQPAASQLMVFKDHAGNTRMSFDAAGSMVMSISPYPSGTRNLGASGNRWDIIYGNTVNTAALVLNGMTHRHTIEILTGLYPATSGGCSAGAVDSDGNLGCSFNSGQVGYASFVIPSDFDGSIDDAKVLFSGTTSATVWTLKFRIIGDTDALTTAFSGLTGYANASVTPANTNLRSVALASPSAALGSSSNAGKLCVVQVTLTTGASATVFRGVKLEY